MVVVVVGDVVEVDQVGFVGAEEIFARQAIFDLFQDTGEHVFLATDSNYPGIPSLCNTI